MPAHCPRGRTLPVPRNRITAITISAVAPSTTLSRPAVSAARSGPTTDTPKYPAHPANPATQAPIRLSRNNSCATLSTPTSSTAAAATRTAIHTGCAEISGTGSCRLSPGTRTVTVTPCALGTRIACANTIATDPITSNHRQCPANRIAAPVATAPPNSTANCSPINAG